MLILLAALALTVAGMWGESKWSQSASETKSFEVLSAAKSPEELREAVGPLGGVLVNRGGGWVAIRYEDSHGLFGWSSAVALDNEGGWFVSHRNFHGQFEYYRQHGLKDLQAIEDTSSVEEMRSQLLELEFKRVPNPK
jgi:hypothetical protein